MFCPDLNRVPWGWELGWTPPLALRITSFLKETSGVRVRSLNRLKRKWVSIGSTVSTINRSGLKSWPFTPVEGGTPSTR